MTIRSGKALPPRGSTLFGTQHIITDQWVRLAQPIRGRNRPLMPPILPSLPTGSFGKTATDRLASFGESPPDVSINTFRNSTRQNWYWLRSGKPFRGRFRPFSRPIMPRIPLGSFGRTRLVGWAPPIASFIWTKGLRSVGGAHPTSGTNRRTCAVIGFVRGNDPCGPAQGVCLNELSKNGGRDASHFIIGGGRERVPRIR